MCDQTFLVLEAVAVQDSSSQKENRAKFLIWCNLPCYSEVPGSDLLPLFRYSYNNSLNHQPARSSPLKEAICRSRGGPEQTFQSEHDSTKNNSYRSRWGCYPENDWTLRFMIGQALKFSCNYTGTERVLFIVSRSKPLVSNSQGAMQQHRECLPYTSLSWTPPPMYTAVTEFD